MFYFCLGVLSCSEKDCVGSTLVFNKNNICLNIEFTSQCDMILKLYFIFVLAIYQDRYLGLGHFNPSLGPLRHHIYSPPVSGHLSPPLGFFALVFIALLIMFLPNKNF